MNTTLQYERHQAADTNDGILIYSVHTYIFNYIKVKNVYVNDSKEKNCYNCL